jgi:hypothetical protein
MGRAGARHYLGVDSDPLIQQSPLFDMIEDWKKFLEADLDEKSGPQFKAPRGRKGR